MDFAYVLRDNNGEEEEGVLAHVTSVERWRMSYRDAGIPICLAKLGSRKGLQKIGTRTITPNDTPHYAPYIAFLHEGGDGEKGKDDVVSGFHMRRHVRVVGQSPLNNSSFIWWKTTKLQMTYEDLEMGGQNGKNNWLLLPKA